MERYLYTEDRTRIEELARRHHVGFGTVARRERVALGKFAAYFKDNGIEPEL